MEMIPIYIIHYDKLKDRKKFLEKQIKKENLKINWFIQKESQPYTKQKIDKYYEYNKKKWNKKAKIIGLNCIARPLGFHEICLNINHFKLIEKISKTKIPILIMEDDVILAKDFKKRVSETFKQLKKVINWDVCFLDWAGNKPSQEKGKIRLVSRNKSKESWITGAYIMKPQAAKKIIKNFNKFTFPIDEEFKYIFKKLKLKVLWTLPPLIKQGSILGIFNSVLKEDREKEGIKKYFLWREKLYKELDKNGLKFVSNLIKKFEKKIKKIIINF